MKNQNSRIEGKTVKVKRQDIRIPIDFYNRLKQIAVERFNAHVHHRSGEPTITLTLLKLAELGIEYIESGLADKKTEIFSPEVFKRLENNESNYSDSNTDKLAENLINRLEKLERNLNDINDDIYNHKLPERIDSIEQHLNKSNTDKTIQELEQKIELLETKLTDNNNDTRALKERLERFSQQFTNTDKSPLDYFEKPTKPDNPEINNTDIQTIPEQQIEV
ncbi:MAG: hypothetical protein ACFBSE_10610, partial [Prochloraceae cyanobacterium]